MNLAITVSVVADHRAEDPEDPEPHQNPEPQNCHAVLAGGRRLPPPPNKTFLASKSSLNQGSLFLGSQSASRRQNNIKRQNYRKWLALPLFLLCS